jgi:serine/threonine protein kinase
LTPDPSKSDDWSERYRFRQLLGQGGMGVIYLAEDKKRHNAPCVIKQLILPSGSDYDQSEAIRLFKREVEVLKSLNHPGVVRFFDNHLSAEGQYFLVMDYLPGQTLDETIKSRGAFSSQAVVEIGIQCCEVLEYLHRLDPPIIYRDLKPSNIMLKPDGQVVFIDFGIARSFQPRETATRVITTGYSAPEQYYGKPELRSDLYSLGATMFQLLTAIRPRPLLTSVPSNFNDSVMPALDHLIKRLTAHESVDRPQSAQVVRYELYHIYREIEPDFDMPEEALFTDWRRQKSYTVLKAKSETGDFHRQPGISQTLKGSMVVIKDFMQKFFRM